MYGVYVHGVLPLVCYSEEIYVQSQEAVIHRILVIS